MRHLVDWNPGDKYRQTSHHQQAVLALRELANEAYRGVEDGARPFEWGIAQIADKDSPGDVDIPDARYLVIGQVMGGFDSDDGVAFADDHLNERDELSAPAKFIATNLAELDDDHNDTHLLPIGMYVIYIGVWDCGKPNQKHYVFWAAPPGTFVAKIEGITQDGTNKRWLYDFSEQMKVTVGYGGWNNKTNGRSGIQNLFNLIEDQNGDPGITPQTYGNGVNSANLPASPATFDIQPIPLGTRVWAQTYTFKDADGNSQTEYWCQYENGVDGVCGT